MESGRGHNPAAARRHVLTIDESDLEFDLDYRAEFDIETEIVGDTLVVGYLVSDDHVHGDPIEDDEAVDVLWFNNGAHRDQWLAENELTDRQFLIERYEHGLVHYSVLSTGNYVDRRWDVAPGVGVLTLDGDWAGERAELLEIANDILDTYSSWCNGDVWGVVTQTFDLSTGEEREADSCWGFIGHTYALDEMKQWMEAEVKSAAAGAVAKAQGTEG